MTRELHPRIFPPAARAAALLALLLIYGAFLTFHIRDPFWGVNDDNAGFFGAAAKALVARGPLALKFGELQSDGAFYLDHPQGITVPLAASYALFGTGEWQTRIVPAFFSLAALAAFWFLVELAFADSLLATVAGFFFVFFPTSMYFGRMMSHEPFVRFFIVASFLLLLLWRRHPRAVYLWLFGAALYAGGLMDWPYAFAALALWGFVYASPEFPRRRLFLALIPAVAALSLATTLLQFLWIGGAAKLWALGGLFLRRSGEAISPLRWILFKGVNELWMYTGVGLALAAYGAWRILRGENRNQAIFFAAFLLPGLLHVVVFYGAAFHHGYWSFYLSPAFALAAAFALTRFPRGLAVFVFAVFAAQCAWQGSALFAKHFYAPEDIALVRAASAAAPPEAPVCLGANMSQHEIEFYFSRPIEFFPCADARTFLLRRFDRDAARAARSVYGLTKPFGENARSASLEIALALEAVKRMPPLAAFFANYLLPGNAAADLARASTEENSFIASRGLVRATCSPELCFFRGR